VVEVLRNVVLDSNDICALIVGESCGEPDSRSLKWGISFPPIPKPPFQGYPEPKVKKKHNSNITYHKSFSLSTVKIPQNRSADQPLFPCTFAPH